MTYNRGEYVCRECAGDNALKTDLFFSTTGRKICSYCRKRRRYITLEALADAVDEVYRESCEQCDSGDGEQPSEIICNQILMLDNSAGKLDIDLVDMLSERESGSAYKDMDHMYDEGMTYIYETYAPPNDGSEHKELWDVFCNRIKYRTRFFNVKIIDLLNSIFIGLGKISYKTNEVPIRTIHPTDSDAIFFRARYAANAEERIKICCQPAQELGPPPSHLAANGRMNPTGISVFYAAFERETCIAEIRLPVGETAISGQFKLERPITIFDLTVLDKIDSEKTISENVTYKDHEVDSFEDRLAFLHKFSEEISKPIPPHKESLDYMPTQALVEYLAYHYNPNIDAVVYASTQTNRKGKNIVFLNHAASVSNRGGRSGTYKAIWGDDYYFISPDKEPHQLKVSPTPYRAPYFDPVQWDESANIVFHESYDIDEDGFLSFIQDSLKIHKILAVNYEEKCFNVETK